MNENSPPGSSTLSFSEILATCEYFTKLLHIAVRSVNRTGNIDLLSAKGKEVVELTPDGVQLTAPALEFVKQMEKRVIGAPQSPAQACAQEAIRETMEAHEIAKAVIRERDLEDDYPTQRVNRVAY